MITSSAFLHAAASQLTREIRLVFATGLAGTYLPPGLRADMKAYLWRGVLVLSFCARSGADRFADVFVGGQSQRSTCEMAMVGEMS